MTGKTSSRYSRTTRARNCSRSRPKSSPRTRLACCGLYLPRDRYTTKVRLRAQGILKDALHGVSVDYSAMVGDSALARLYVVVRGERGHPVPQVDAAALERALAAAVRSWDEDLTAEVTRRLGEDRARTLLE